MHRIPGSGSAVLLMHGLFSSGDDFVTAGPRSALAYFLADRGYDVWIGNARGNKHSRRHRAISPECAEFWNFTIHETGHYDLPAMIDYVLLHTGESKLSYIGHAFGTTVFYIMMSELPEYNNKVSLMINLCPVAYMEYIRSFPFRLLAIDPFKVQFILEASGLHEFVSDGPLKKALTSIFCGNSPIPNVVCSNIIYLFFGYDLGQQNMTNLAVNLGHTPAGASTRQVMHYGQLVRSGRFCKFDFGDKARNLKMYNSANPPEYRLDRVTVPVAIFYSNTDWISNVTDVERLRDQLLNVVDYTLFVHYWHFDYLWATNVNRKVNPRIVKLIKQYHENKQEI